MVNIKRTPKDRYYMNIAKKVAERSTCFRARQGAIIIRDDQIISTGYNGAPRKTKDCLERKSCLRNELKIPSGQRYEMCRSVHAEQNAVINAARAGVSLLGGTIYLHAERINFQGEVEIVEAYPCFICKKIIVNSGLEKMICNDPKGELKVYKISDWTDDWKENDLLDDMACYGEKLDIKK
jgi:dCMP deaminase